jgi:hypothetical protein
MAGLRWLARVRKLVVTAIFVGNTARLYNFDKRADRAEPDRFTEIKAEYLRGRPGRSNLRYGWVRNSG